MYFERKIPDFMNKKWILTGTALIIIYKLLDSIGEIASFSAKLIDLLLPCILGLVFALFLYMPCKKLKEFFMGIGIRKYSAGLGIFLVYALIFGGIVISAVYLFPSVYKNSEQLFKNFPVYIDKAEGYINSHRYLKQIGVLANVENYFDAEKLTSYVVVIKNAAGNFVSVFLGIIISIHLIAEGKNLAHFWGKVIKKYAGEKVYNKCKKLKYAAGVFSSYFSGILLDCLVVAIGVSIGFTFMDMVYPVLFGVLVGAGNLVPFFGPVVTSSVAVVVAFVSGGLWKAVWVAIFLVSVSVIETNVVQPRILSKSTRLSPLAVLLTVTVAGGLFGFGGMILGVPVMATLKMIAGDFFKEN